MTRMQLAVDSLLICGGKFGRRLGDLHLPAWEILCEYERCNRRVVVSRVVFGLVRLND